MGERRQRFVLGFAVLIVVLVGLVVANIACGGSSVSPERALSIVLGGPVAAVNADTGAKIVWDIRLPRLCAAALLGGMLSIAGFFLQTLFANPIAGPYVLGISSGAKLAVALMLVWALGQGVALGSVALIAAAFVGALASMLFVLAVSGRVSGAATLIVCGVMIGYVCAAITDLVVTFADDANIVNLHSWAQGSFSGLGWESVGPMAVVAVASLACAVALAKPMGAYQLGESYAASVGVNVRRLRGALIVVSSVLAACVTAFAGPISFVGIAVPQLAKSLFGTAKPLVVIPGAFLAGASFCLLADLIARSAFAPTELGISTVTAILGAPVVLWMLIARHRQGVGMRG